MQEITKNNTFVLTGNLALELKTIQIMLEIYCVAHHDNPICEQCNALIIDAEKKLDRCVYGDVKPACKQCSIHCYKPEHKQQIQIIMQYAGPKMLLKHPILAIRHLVKNRKSFPHKVPVGLSNYHKRKKDQ